jgi:hypothetical protein
MPAKKPPPVSVLARAAELRAEGSAWKYVGEAVGRSPETVRRWPQVFPDLWAAAVRAAQRRVIDDAADEAVCVLRQLIRTDDPKIRHQAAWHLIYQRLELTKAELAAAAHADPPPPSDAQLIADFVEAHPRDQLIKLAANLLDAPLSERLALSGLRAAPPD